MLLRLPSSVFALVCQPLDVADVFRLCAVSKRTEKIIKNNLFWSMYLGELVEDWKLQVKLRFSNVGKVWTVDKKGKPRPLRSLLGHRVRYSSVHHNSTSTLALAADGLCILFNSRDAAAPRVVPVPGLLPAERVVSMDCFYVARYHAFCVTSRGRLLCGEPSKSQLARYDELQLPTSISADFCTRAPVKLLVCGTAQLLKGFVVLDKQGTAAVFMFKCASWQIGVSTRAGWPELGDYVTLSGKYVDIVHHDMKICLLDVMGNFHVALDAKDYQRRRQLGDLREINDVPDLRAPPIPLTFPRNVHFLKRVPQTLLFYHIFLVIGDDTPPPFPDPAKKQHCGHCGTPFVPQIMGGNSCVKKQHDGVLESHEEEEYVHQFDEEPELVMVEKWSCCGQYASVAGCVLGHHTN